MTLRSPPLNALRAFEAAARHNSFVRAGEELHVTPAAISHQIKELEHVLGVALFERKPRGVSLTLLGQRYWESIARALEMVSHATLDLTSVRLEGPLKISLPRSFAHAWLAPRLKPFCSRFPDIALSIQSNDSIANLHDGDADLAVRFGRGDYHGLHVDFLLADAAAVVVASDRLATAGETNATLLESAVLLSDSAVAESEQRMTWDPWLREAGVVRAEADPRITFSDGGLALSTCLAGGGLCISRLSLSLDYLRRQQLTAISPWRTTDFSYFLVRRDRDLENPKVSAVVAWLKEEAASFANAALESTGHQLSASSVAYS